jgi:hypothetical protein
MEQKVRVIKKGAELKIEASIESQTIMGLPLGGEFAIDTIPSLDWVKIKLPPNKDGIILSGFLHVSYIEFIGAPAIVRPKVDAPEITRPKIDGPWKEKPKINDIVIDQEYETDKKPISSEDYFNWQRTYSAAKSKASLWGGIGLVGALITVGGAGWIILGELKPNKEFDYGWYKTTVEYHAPTIAWIVTGSGALIGAIGIIAEASAIEYVRALESEGENKGYIKFIAGIIPQFKSVGIQFSLFF